MNILTRPLRIPKKGEKVYKLNERQIQDILKLRGEKNELDPGMGGVSPKVLDHLLVTESELVSLDFAITADCNFKCIHCYRPDGEWGKLVLDFDLISKTVDQAITELGVRYIVLTGGEPMMYRNNNCNYFDIVDKILSIAEKEKVNVKVLTFSDVALITEEKARMLAERKVSLCLKRDSLDHEVQNGILDVKKGSQQMAKGYENLFKAGYGSDPNLAISVNQVLRKGQFNTLTGSVDLHLWVRENGMEHSVCPIHYCGEALNDAQEEGVNTLEVKVLYDILAAIDEIKYNDLWEVYSSFPKNKTCNRPGRGVHIRATGMVTSCSESPLISEYIFGNIHEKDFIEMIRSDKLKRLRKEFVRREGTYICNPEVCDLNANYLCRGGCAARAAYSTINPNTGSGIKNSKPQRYSLEREDPICPGWAVLAQKQGVLQDGLYEKIADKLLGESKLIDSGLAGEVRKKVVIEFNNFRGIHTGHD